MSIEWLTEDHVFGIAFIVTMFLALFFSLFIYFLPAYIASKRRHRHRVSILILNFFFGWSLFGWAAALLWAVTGSED